MKDGFIQQIGTPRESFDHPADLFVASLIGTPQMNFFDAKLLKEGGKYNVTVGDVKVSLPESKQKVLVEKNVNAQDITLGVRPSHITLGEGANTLSAMVDVSEMMGIEVHLHDNARGRDVVVIVPTMDLSSVNFAAGTTLHLHFDGNVCHHFDSEGKNFEF